MDYNRLLFEQSFVGDKLQSSTSFFDTDNQRMNFKVDRDSIRSFMIEHLDQSVMVYAIPVT